MDRVHGVGQDLSDIVTLLTDVGDVLEVAKLVDQMIFDGGTVLQDLVSPRRPGVGSSWKACCTDVQQTRSILLWCSRCRHGIIGPRHLANKKQLAHVQLTASAFAASHLDSVS